ncbi:MAG TPA: hypothetical protein VF350_04400 [Candidatus Bathyarchaeia archaeon]
MALLNNPVAIIITISLVIQIIVLLLLVYGYWLKKKMKFRNHGIVMALATVLHLALVLYVMIPSFVEAVIPKYIVLTPLAITSIVGLIHGILGTIALSLGVWFVASWGFRKNIKGCINKKKIMSKTIIVWITSLIFGIMLYAIFIGPLLAR